MEFQNIRAKTNEFIVGTKRFTMMSFVMKFNEREITKEMIKNIFQIYGYQPSWIDYQTKKLDGDSKCSFVHIILHLTFDIFMNKDEIE